MKFWSTSVFILFFCTYSAFTSSSELKRYVGIIKNIKKDNIVLDISSGGELHIGFVCDPEICQSTAQYNAGDEVLLGFGSVKRTNSDRRINKLISIRKCLGTDTECMNISQEATKTRELAKIDSKKYWEQRLACQRDMDADLETDSRYVADTWVSRIRRFTIDRNIDYGDLTNSEASGKCVETIIQSHHNAVVEICEKYGCGEGIGGGCEHIAAYSGTDALKVFAIKQCTQ